MKKKPRKYKYQKAEWQEEALEILEDLKKNNAKKAEVPARRQRHEYPLLEHLLKDRLRDDLLEICGASVNDIVKKRVELEPLYSPAKMEEYCRAVEAGITISSLAKCCIEVVAQNLERYDSEYVQNVFVLLPPQHTLLLSSMACRHGTLSDSNVTSLVHSTTENLVLGGDHLSDRGVSKAFPVVTVMGGGGGEVRDTWEDWYNEDDEGGGGTVVEVTGCPNLRTLSILSPCVTQAPVIRLASLPLSRVNTLHLHGPSSFPCTPYVGLPCRSGTLAIAGVQTLCVAELRGHASHFDEDDDEVG